MPGLPGLPVNHVSIFNVGNETRASVPVRVSHRRGGTMILHGNNPGNKMENWKSARSTTDEDNMLML
jgi:hypothetical protein